ncbi:MAG TPA: XRE family transcriptional regulator [Pyrinomonadaceae bacterium]|jgi:Zn-dependent peptidase ImmA (M78 family)/DNA-binding XRE family transcriptional regulator
MAASINQMELARRLRLARTGVGFSQDAVATELKVPRPTISQIEAGRRGVSSLELMKLARLYRCPLSAFFEDDFDLNYSEDPLTVLYRATALRSEDQEVVAGFATLCRNYSQLEDLLGLAGEIRLPDFSNFGEPRNKLEAIRQGEQVASEERRRLGIGDDPIRNAFELLESQGIRVFVRELHESSISGLFMYGRAIGPCILINGKEHRNRLAFNAAHEYAHVLLDRKLQARASTTSQQLGRPEESNEFLEVRANSFAAAFLLPASGIERFLWDRGLTRRTKSSLQVVHVLYLHRAFGVSYQAALYRLQNLNWLTREQREELAKCHPDKLGQELGLQDDGEKYAAEYPLRYVYLALEAYRQEKIPLEKLADLIGKGLPETRQLVKKLRVRSGAAVQA